MNQEQVRNEASRHSRKTGHSVKIETFVDEGFMKYVERAFCEDCKFERVHISKHYVFDWPWLGGHVVADEFEFAKEVR